MSSAHPTAEKRLEASLMEKHRSKQTPAAADAPPQQEQQQSQGRGGNGDNEAPTAAGADNAAALDPENFDAGVREAGTSELERPLGVDARGERSAADDGASDDYSRAAVNAAAHAGGLPAEGARMGMIKP